MSEEIKKIMKLSDEISELITTLEKKQRIISNELINLIIDKDKRIAVLEQEIARSTGKPIPKVSATTSLTVAKIDLSDVLTETSTETKTPAPKKFIESTKSEDSFASILTSEETTPISPEESTSEKSATMSRYGGVSVLKKVGGSSKFKPRTTAPPTTPISETSMGETPGAKKQNKDALLLLEGLKSQISEETTTHELYKILETVRDELANMIGFSSIIRDIGTVSNKLKHAPDLALDSSSIEAFIKKVEEWKSKL